jgi:biopolymer transport protein ExbD
MRRRTIKKNHIEVELFPFLSILACTIGTLILLIIVLTTQALNKQEVTIVAKSDAKASKDERKGANQSKTPRYIECRDDGVVLHPNKTFVPRANILDNNSPVRQLLAELKANKNKQYLIVALRPDGIDMFNQIRDLLEGEGIDIGYEPIEYGLQLTTELGGNNK